MRPAIYPVTTLHLNHNQIICSTSKKQKEIILTGIPSIAPYTMPTTSELPKNTAHWTVNPERAILLIHDMQGGLKEQVQQSVNFLSLLSETIPLPKHRYQWASDRTELT